MIAVQCDDAQREDRSFRNHELAIASRTEPTDGKHMAQGSNRQRAGTRQRCVADETPQAGRRMSSLAHPVDIAGNEIAPRPLPRARSIGRLK